MIKTNLPNKQYKYRFSVFTATYNRSDLLPAVYNDLLAQTYKNFEWVIVNDGSSDNTDEVVGVFLSEGKLAIRYIPLEKNGGKHIAWKMATKIFQGRYILTADDDNRLTNDALAIFDEHWSQLETESCYMMFWEIRARCTNETGSLIGKALPAPYIDADYNTNNYIWNNECEMAGCRKLEVLKNEAAVPDKFLYDDKVSNFAEAIRWSRAARAFKTRFIPEVTCIISYTKDSLSFRRSEWRGRKSPADRKREYNLLVSCYYTITERRDLLLKYAPWTYLKKIALLDYLSIRIKDCSVKKLAGIRPMERLMLALLFIPVKLLAWWKLRK